MAENRTCITSCAREARAWLLNDAAPLWAERGALDGRGFVEALTLEGASTGDTRVRVRVQARQTYVFSQLALLGWRPDRARALGRLGVETLIRRCRRQDGLMGTILDLGGGLADPTGDLYDTAFAVFAFAWAHKANADADALSHMHATIDAIDAVLKHPAGGYAESAPTRLPRRQNPHMHLVEAFLAAFEATGDAAMLARADELIDLMRVKWLDDDGLLEFFDDDWRPLTGDRGDRLEPGHMFEWAWLLARRADLAGEPLADEAAALYRRALRGCRGDYGFAVQTTSRGGGVLDGSRRTWPQTEALKAHLCMAQAGDGDASERAAKMWRGLKADYLDPAPAGGWIDRYDADGRPAARDMPASTGYHLVGAACELMRVAGLLNPAAEAASADAPTHVG